MTTTGSLLINPKGTHFKDQEPGEQVIILARKHTATKLSWIFYLAIMLVIPPFLYSELVINLGMFDFLPPQIFILLAIIWYLLSTAYAILNFLHWFFTVHIVTDRRIVDVDYFGFLHYEVSEASLRKVEDVTYKLKGIMGTVFNYGNVYIQTAATSERLDFISVPNPERIYDIITDLVHRKRKNV